MDSLSKTSVGIYEILSNTNLDSLKTKIVERQIDSLFYRHGLPKVIDEVSEYYGLDIKPDKRLLEIFARRNLIVHNNSLPNEAYTREFGSMEIKTDFKYLDSTFVQLGNFSEQLILELSAKSSVS